MFLSNRQSLFATGILVLLLLISGILDIMDNFVVIIFLFGGILAIIVNIIMALTHKKNPE